MLLVKILQYSQENTCVGVSTLKEIPIQVFPVDIAKFLRLPILKNICERLLLNCFIDSLLHRPKGSRFILYDSVRFHGPSHRFSLSWASLVLNRVPT